MLIDTTVPSALDEPLPPPAWLVGCIVATVLFVAVALLAALPQHSSRSDNEFAAPLQPSATTTEVARSTPIPFDPINLTLPIL